MSGRESIEGIGKATVCVVSTYHRPAVLRFVWHHVQPDTCGGPTTPANLIEVCDSCHYSIHILLWQLANGGVTVTSPNRAQLGFARAGYRLCVAAGTVGKIPKEA